MSVTDLTPEPPEEQGQPDETDDGGFTEEQRAAWRTLISSAFSDAPRVEGDAAYLKGAAFGTFVCGVWSTVFPSRSPDATNVTQMVMAYVHSARDGDF